MPYGVVWGEEMPYGVVWGCLWGLGWVWGHLGHPIVIRIVLKVFIGSGLSFGTSGFIPCLMG